MNIFVLDTDPVLAAQMHCDKHVPKMVVEAAQMMASALGVCKEIWQNPCLRRTDTLHEQIRRTGLDC